MITPNIVRYKDFCMKIFRMVKLFMPNAFNTPIIDVFSITSIIMMEMTVMIHTTAISVNSNDTFTSCRLSQSNTWGLI